jgi:hypothetical protein
MKAADPREADDVGGRLRTPLDLTPERCVRAWENRQRFSGERCSVERQAVMGRRPVFFRVPFVSPSLSSHWIRLVTRADHRLAAELVEGLTSDLLATRLGLWAAAGLPAPIALEEAALRALGAERDHLRLRSVAFEAVAGALTRRV